MWGSAFQILAVISGGAIGGILRYVFSQHVALRTGSAPAGTLVVNVTGSALIGLAAGLVVPVAGDNLHMAWLLLVVGILGSYTTVSSFSLQTLELLRTGRVGAALVNVASSVVLCLGAAALIYALVRAVLP